jgi:hypothetical protein
MIYKTFLENTLRILYLTKTKKPNHYIDMNRLIKKLGYIQTSNTTFEVVKYLEAQGYINVYETITGYYCEIAHSGILHVEEKLANEEGYEEIFKDKKIFIFREDLLYPSKKQIFAQRNEIIELINQAKKIMNEKEKEKKHDRISDLEILKIEICKIYPDKEIIQKKFSIISEIEIIRNIAIELKDRLNLYW